MTTNKITESQIETFAIELLETLRSTITEHLQNIFSENELQEDSVCANLAHTAEDDEHGSEGKLIRIVIYYD